MKYKGYRILATEAVNNFYELDKKGEPQRQAYDIKYEQPSGDFWYSVVDKYNWAIQSFASIEEAKQYIREIK